MCISTFSRRSVENVYRWYAGNYSPKTPQGLSISSPEKSHPVEVDSSGRALNSIRGLPVTRHRLHDNLTNARVFLTSDNNMVDRLFSDTNLAALYDAFCSGIVDFGFYLPMLMSSKAVLDVGCGTGALLHLAREAGHTGRLCGLDPANGMLEQARKRTDIEWILGDLASVRWEREFDLVVMTGHAFQVFIDDKEIHASLATIRSALTEEGCFAFETRNPLARGWEAWTLENAVEIVDPTGTSVRLAHEVDTPVNGNTVSFTSIFSSPGWDRPQLSRSTLRFVDLDSLSRFLTNAGFHIEKQYGDWDRSPLTKTSPEIITIARGRRRDDVPCAHDPMHV